MDTKNYKWVIMVGVALLGSSVLGQTLYDTGTQDPLIAGNTSDIADNDSDIAVNGSDIADNDSDIAVNGSDIAVNVSDIAVNGSDIAVNGSDIAVNGSDIAVNGSDIAVNGSDIADNDSDIAVNGSDIADNDSDIAVNGSDIADNDSDIAVNGSDIADNDSDIAVNVSDIAVNVSDIADNDSDIAVNASDIAQEVADRSELISDMGPNADGNQVVHIGDNSLITEELDGTQRLRAEDTGNNSIPIQFDGDQGVYVDNYVNVTAPDAGPTFSSSTNNTSLLNPQTGSSLPTTTPVATRLETVSGTQTTGSSGGVLLENNGDVTLSQSGGTQTSIEVIKATTFDVYNADQPLAGQPVPGTQQYVAGYEDASGTFVELSPQFATEAALDAWITATPLSDAAYNPVRQTAALTGTGGDLQVGGDANIDGTLTTAELVAGDTTLQSDLQVDGNANVDGTLDVTGAATLDDTLTVAGDTTLQSDLQVDGNANVDGTLDVTGAATLDDTLTVAGDTTLQSDLQVDGNANVDGTLDVTGAATLDDTLTVAGDTTLQSDLQVDGNANVDGTLDVTGNARFLNDVDVADRLDVGDDVFVAGRAVGLQAQVDNNRSDINSNSRLIGANKKTLDKHARGIAMTAALSQTTVLPGMTHALDVNAANFAGETGLALTYSARVSENVQLNFGAATTVDLDETVIRTGVGIQW